MNLQLPTELENPLTTFVLPETLAATNLAATVTSLQNEGVTAFTYALVARLFSPRGPLPGSFEFTLTGRRPGIYFVQSSTNLATWSNLSTATNILGSVVFTDVEAGLSRQKFNRARLSPSAI
jgi:hypothetical protein